jgi:organic hydroperoxide reductase OsmC/OhrA
MSNHHASLNWKRTTSDFAYESYDRSHEIRFGGGLTLMASAAPEYKGRTELANPEEQLVASISSCHMLTFLALASLRKLVVDSYEDDAQGTLEKTDPKGKLWLSRVTLSPKVRFAEGHGPASPEAYRELHERAHAECFIANSVKTEVSISI